MPRIIHAITGSDRISFLQGLVTNDVAGLGEDLIYAALLTPQGKYLADFFLWQAGDVAYLDVAAELSDSLIQRFNMYRLRADVAIAATELQVRRGTGAAPEGAKADPRHGTLGWRLYGDEGGDDGSDWDALRVAHCIPETGVELGAETYILEAGFERLNGVDFRKGCYVGQEVTARMKHKTELRKGLTTVQITGSAPIETAIMVGDKEAGVLFTQSGGQAIAYLRFDRAKGERSAGVAGVVWQVGG